MLSSFEAKGKLGAKQLKDQLHTAWPVPNSRSALEHLRRELVGELKQSLEVVRMASWCDIVYRARTLSVPSSSREGLAR